MEAGGGGGGEGGAALNGREGRRWSVGGRVGELGRAVRVPLLRRSNTIFTHT